MTKRVSTVRENRNLMDHRVPVTDHKPVMAHDSALTNLSLCLYPPVFNHTEEQLPSGSP